MKISTRKMSYEEWKEQRRKGIGGSDAGVVAGLNKWKAPIRLYLEKIGEFQDEEQNIKDHKIWLCPRQHVHAWLRGVWVVDSPEKLD